MATVNERLQSAAISHAVDLQQLSNAEARKIMALLNRADADLKVRLMAALERMSADRFTIKYLNAVLSSVRALNSEVYANAGQALIESVDDLAVYEAGYQQALFTSALPNQVLVVVPLAKMDLAQVRQIAMARPFQGKLLGEWLSGLEEGRATRIRDTIRNGMVSGQTTDQIVRSIMGSKAQGYADGIIDRSRRDIEAVVRTAISHTAQGSRDAFYAANSDLMAGVTWLSTLDFRTSSPCRIRDGLKYSNYHQPVGHKIPWLAGPGRLHWQCRSTSCAIIKGWEDLGLSPDEIEEGTRASLTGQVPESVSYGDWLKDQKAPRQDEVLGSTRGKLLREGGLPLDKFYNDKGTMLSLDELRARDSAAFERAGV